MFNPLTPPFVNSNIHNKTIHHIHTHANPPSNQKYSYTKKKHHRHLSNKPSNQSTNIKKRTLLHPEGRKGLKEHLPAEERKPPLRHPPAAFPPINHTRPRAVCLQSSGAAATRHMSGMNGKGRTARVALFLYIGMEGG